MHGGHVSWNHKKYTVLLKNGVLKKFIRRNVHVVEPVYVICGILEKIVSIYCFDLGTYYLWVF